MPAGTLASHLSTHLAARNLAARRQDKAAQAVYTEALRALLLHLQRHRARNAGALQQPLLHTQPLQV